MRTALLVIAVCAVSAGCTFDPPGLGGGADVGGIDARTEDAGPLDAARSDLGVFEDAGPADQGPVDMGGLDAGVPEDVGFADATPQDLGLPDAEPTDTGAMRDTGPIDAGVPDTGPPDTGHPDTGPADTGTPDTGPTDAGMPDTGPADTGPPDTGSPDTGPTDAGTPDTGIGPDGGFSQGVSNVPVPPLGITPVVTVNSDCILNTATPSLSGQGCPANVNLVHGLQGNGESVALWTVDELRVAPASQLTIIGDRPLIIVAYDRVLIDGFVDLSGFGASSGPGANLNTCLNSTGGEGQDFHGAGGGGHAQPGAAGGDRSGISGSGGAGGLARGNASLVPLVGGCRGGHGESFSGTNFGGGAGGALQISAANRIEISGGIFALGAGGEQATYAAASGGGGAGGSLLLEADFIQLNDSALLMAGGGGGGGGRDGISGNNRDGDPGEFASMGPAQGGRGAGGGGRGGNGGTRTLAPDLGQDSPFGASAGGGGGAVGRVRINARVCTLGTTNPPLANAELSGNASCFPLP